MSNNGYPKESSDLIKRIEGLDFVNGNVEIESVGKLNSRNFNNTLIYNKSAGKYIANVSCCGNNYKLSIPINRNRPNPKFEKNLKKVFS